MFVVTPMKNKKIKLNIDSNLQAYKKIRKPMPPTSFAIKSKTIYKRNNQQPQSEEHQ